MNQQDTHYLAICSASAAVGHITRGNETMDDDFEPLLLEGDLPSLPDIHADDLLDWDLLSCESARNGRKECEFSDEVSAAISSPQLSPARKTIEAWLIEQVGTIIEANACSPGKSLLFPKTFNGLIAKHALDAHMSRLNVSVEGESMEGTTDTTNTTSKQGQGADKKSTKNQSRRGMTYSKNCERCGEKKKKCNCVKVIDASVGTFNNDSVRSESFGLKPELCIYVSERGATSKIRLEAMSQNWIDREMEEEKAKLSKESNVEVFPKTRKEYDKDIETEIGNESLWTDSIIVVQCEDEKKRKINGQ